MVGTRSSSSGNAPDRGATSSTRDDAEAVTRNSLSQRRLAAEIKAIELMEQRNAADAILLKRLMEARPGQNPRSGASAETGEELVPIVCTLAAEFPGILPELINKIYLSTFRAANLCHLRGGRFTGGQALVWKTRAASPKDFDDDPLVFIEAFLIYSRIFDSFHGETHPEARRAMMIFITEISRRAQSYTAETTLLMALRLVSAAMNTPTNPEAWNCSSPEWDRAFFTRSTLKPAPDRQARQGSKRQRRSDDNDGASNEACRLFNEGRCNYRNCRFRHECSKCSKNHPAVDCKG